MAKYLFDQPVDLPLSPLAFVARIDYDVFAEVVYRIVERSDNNTVAGPRAPLRKYSTHIAKSLGAINDQSVDYRQLTWTRQKCTSCVKITYGS